MLPHPHVYSDRLIRPGDPPSSTSFTAARCYRTCYYRTFAVGSASHAQQDAYVRAREYMDRAIAVVRPGATTADVVAEFPKAEEFGFPSEEAAFGLQYGHGVGLSIWEKPIFSRLVSLDHPEELREGMFFAIETYWPSADGVGAARIEEEMVVTADGCEVVTKFPAEELLVAGQRYFTVGGSLRPCASRSHTSTPRQAARSWLPRRRDARCRLPRRPRRSDHRGPDPEPKDGEVLLRVLRSGMCGTDATEWKSGPRTFPVDRVHPVTGHRGPMILGHEFVGEVLRETTGGRHRVGSIVASGAGVSCGTCDRCREGRTNVCRGYVHAGAEHGRRHGRAGRSPGKHTLAAA